MICKEPRTGLRKRKWLSFSNLTCPLSLKYAHPVRLASSSPPQPAAPPQPRPRIVHKPPPAALPHNPLQPLDSGRVRRHTGARAPGRVCKFGINLLVRPELACVPETRLRRLRPPAHPSRTPAAQQCARLQYVPALGVSHSRAAARLAPWRVEQGKGIAF